ncbi:SGNH/GDSL hydrolase family protein [Nocardia sp. NPDC051832]|uniref:SGNH/GDSL hydrolase family protein n=1 Tax=Nocardia sp. NPDC051832 TaxID=3155673 RepID=UPI00341776C5
MPKTLRRRCLTAAALAAALLPALAPVGSAAPAPGKSLVVLGDSFSANGDITAALENSDPAATPDCSHGPTSWPTQLAQRLGVWGTTEFADFSCRGASLVSGPGLTLAHQARKADAEGAFGAGTGTVLIQSGLNDTWGTNSMRLRQTLVDCVLQIHLSCGPEAAAEGRATDWRGISGELYTERIRPIVQYVRYYAPKARIILVGYPELARPGQQHLCVDVFGIGSIVQLRAGSAIELFDRIDAAQRTAAELLGVEFFDARAETAGHGLCSAQPWVAGLLDPRSELLGTPLHPTVHGDRVVAAALHRRIAG